MHTSTVRAVATPPCATAIMSTICTTGICITRTGTMSTSTSIEVSAKNPERCTPEHRCKGHEPGHKHGPGCGHEAVPHGGHCDDHGPLEKA